jgi:hypothetical protein
MIKTVPAVRNNEPKIKITDYEKPSVFTSDIHLLDVREWIY